MTSKKISAFTQVQTFEQTDLVNIVRSATNYTVPFSAYAAALGVTGSINIVGGSGTPVLEQPSATVNNIRTIENGNGILASVSAQNGISIKQDITVDQTGAALIVDKDIQSPVFRSLVAGSGGTVAVSGDTIIIGSSVVGATNTVIINQESDFPAAVAGVITLTDNTNYIIAAAVSTSNRFVLGANNAITANNIFSPVLTYTGSGTMFTGVDVNLSMSEISINCPSGKVFDMSSPTTVGGDFFSIDSVVVNNCATYGTFNDLRVVVLSNSSALNADQGITVLGSTNWSIFNTSSFALTTTSATFIGIDFGTSVHQTLELNDLLFRGPAGAIGLKGAASSANLSSGNLATVSGGEFTGGLTPLDTLTNSDIRWIYRGNAGIKETIVDALLQFSGNAAATVISIVNTPVIVNATWVCERQSKFSCTTGGRATQLLERGVILPVDVSVGLISSGGGAIDATVYIALNGSVIANSGRQLAISGTNAATVSIPWQLDLEENDYLEVYVENNTGTTNIIVEHAVLRVN